MLIGALVIAAKFWDDTYYSNAIYAKIGGIGLTDMNHLECNLLFVLSFDLMISPKEFNACLVSLMDPYTYPEHDLAHEMGKTPQIVFMTDYSEEDSLSEHDRDANSAHHGNSRLGQNTVVKCPAPPLMQHSLYSVEGPICPSSVLDLSKMKPSDTFEDIVQESSNGCGKKTSIIPMDIMSSPFVPLRKILHGCDLR